MLKWNNEPTLEKQWYINWKSSWGDHINIHGKLGINMAQIDSQCQVPTRIRRVLDEWISGSKNSGSSQPQVCTRVAYLRAPTSLPVGWSDANQFTHFKLHNAISPQSFHFLSSLATERLWPSVATATKWPSADAGKMASEAPTFTAPKIQMHLMLYFCRHLNNI